MDESKSLSFWQEFGQKMKQEILFIYFIEYVGICLTRNYTLLWSLLYFQALFFKVYITCLYLGKFPALGLFSMKFYYTGFLSVQKEANRQFWWRKQTQKFPKKTAFKHNFSTKHTMLIKDQTACFLPSDLDQLSLQRQLNF